MDFSDELVSTLKQICHIKRLLIVSTKQCHHEQRKREKLWWYRTWIQECLDVPWVGMCKTSSIQKCEETIILQFSIPNTFQIFKTNRKRNMEYSYGKMSGLPFISMRVLPLLRLQYWGKQGMPVKKIKNAPVIVLLEQNQPLASIRANQLIYISLIYNPQPRNHI